MQILFNCVFLYNNGETLTRKSTSDLEKYRSDSDGIKGTKQRYNELNI